MDESYTLLQPPKYVGKYVIEGQVSFMFRKKPNCIHRFFTNLFLGWEWKDEK